MKHNGLALSKRSASNGFTLIELVVVATIVLLLTGTIVVRYTTYTNRQRVKQVALNLKSDLRLAQIKAMSGNIPTSAACTLFEGYIVSFTDTSYSLGPKCSEGDSYTEKQTVTLPGAVFIDPIPSSFIFYPLNRGTSLTSDLPIVITGAGITSTVTVEAYTGTTSE